MVQTRQQLRLQKKRNATDDESTEAESSWSRECNLKMSFLLSFGKTKRNAIEAE